MPNNDFIYGLGTINVGGRVTGLPNNSGVVVNYTVNGAPGSVVTDANGIYLLPPVPYGADVVIFAPTATGYTATPTIYTLLNVVADNLNNNFNFVRSVTTHPPAHPPATGVGTNLLTFVGLAVVSVVVIGLVNKKKRAN
jgi:LPXTG-motif cell wall-anchored protein